MVNESEQQTGQNAKGQGESGKEGEAAAKPEPVDDMVTTRHSLTVGEHTLHYTATAGRVVLREEVHTEGTFDGHRPKAEVFMVAYTLDGASAGTRPVTFAFNGGPGSSSVWLHLGVLGPRRIVMGDAGDLAPPPYALADNAETLLAHSDLVFIDPMSTGYSRTIEGGKPGDYHGYQRDLDLVGEVIRLWTSRNGRWMSPKFLAGESYGTVRASGLAGHLQDRYGMYLNGIMLISSVLDMGTIRFTPNNDWPYPLFLPTYASIAHYHGLHGDRPLVDVQAEAEHLARRDYPYVLALGARATAEERADMVRRVAAVTGLSEEYVDRSNLRIEHLRFFRELLRHRRQATGRLDARFAGWEPDDVGERGDDPSYHAILGPYAAALNHYVRAELEYSSDLPYEILTDKVRPWSYKEFEGQSVNVAVTLSAAMRHNRHLRVHVACGYYDGATPYHAAEHTLAHLEIPDELRGNIEVRYYEAGHMMYVHEPSRLRQSADIAAFVTSASGPAQNPT